MDFGVVLLTQHPPDRDPGAIRRELRDQAEQVEALGYDSVWVGEHHFTEDDYLDNLEVLPYLAGLTDRVALGTAVCLLPLHHPVRLAEQTATLDVLADGRLVLGAGAGYRREEFEVLGVPRAERARRTSETIELLRRLWTADGVSYHGDIFDFEDVSVNPKPVQDGGPPVWIGASGTPALRRAAGLGDAWITDSRPPLDTLLEHKRTYDDALDGEPAARPVRREVFVAETDEAARETALPALEDKYDTYRSWDGGHAMGADPTAFEEVVADRFIVGSPATVIEGIERYQTLGFDTVLMRHQWPAMAHEDAVASLELFADEVIPAF